MKSILSIAAAGFLLALSAQSAQARSVPLLHLYGVDPNAPGEVYLGCINCPQHDNRSIGNQIGHGSQIEEASIFNRIGTYGSSISDYSACNPNARQPPYIKAPDGTIVGVMTTNKRLVDEYYRADPRILGAC